MKSTEPQLDIAVLAERIVERFPSLIADSPRNHRRTVGCVDSKAILAGSHEGRSGFQEVTNFPLPRRQTCLTLGGGTA